ncbi:MAG: DUF190 domain-containing protein [Armatimonadota bacterium]
MSVSYNVIEVFTSEEARADGKPVADAIIDVLRNTRIAARCFVSRGHAGYYESGEIASAKLEALSSNLPLKIEIILPAPELDDVLEQITEIVSDGMVIVAKAEVHSHRSRYRLIPRQMLVRDIMAKPAVSVARDTPVRDVVRLLLNSEFNAVPVVDEDARPVGIVTQGDLVRRADMPLRLGLLDDADHGVISQFHERAARICAEDIMTSPVRTVAADRTVSGAVRLMLTHHLKRLPVVDQDGILVGVLARLDVFRAALRRPTKPTAASPSCRVEWEGVPRVRDCMTRETGTVNPDSSINEVLRVLDEESVQRVAVVDRDHRLLGLLTDGDILAAIDHSPKNLLGNIISRLPLPGREQRATGDVTLSTTARELMETDLITVSEDSTLEDALTLMVDHSLKRLPVIDDDGRYQGMISRNALLTVSMPE